MLFEDTQTAYLNYLKMSEYSLETIKGYTKDLNSLNRFLQGHLNGLVYLDDITRDDLEEYLIYLAEERNLQPRSRNRYLASVSSMFNYALKKEWIEQNPAATIDSAKVVEKQKVSLTETEIEELLGTITHPIIRTAILFMLKTGLRINEAIELKMEQVDFEKSLIYVVNGKGKKNRTVPLAASVQPHLLDYLETERDSDSPYFFATKKTGRLSGQYVNMELRKAAKKLKWTKKVTNHTLRRSFATNLLSKGTNVVTIQHLLGHASLKTTSIYLNVQIDDLRDAVNQL
ncbi:tyrosine-type recombinase/integrase [Bacillus sp. FJAT-42315]|uniref:tyrosine-type recombinase/integrase n=1 Tax=Bacillus sp. FJAT-42315 TaxID=2014077 RepID=UPI0018E21FAD|nr:tyrosine-type recombinase/integrase [Bacillus sp. FJAT-42315]